MSLVAAGEAISRSRPHITAPMVLGVVRVPITRPAKLTVSPWFGIILWILGTMMGTGEGASIVHSSCNPTASPNTARRPIRVTVLRSCPPFCKLWLQSVPRPELLVCSPSTIGRQHSWPALRAHPACSPPEGQGKEVTLWSRGTTVSAGRHRTERTQCTQCTEWTYLPGSFGATGSGIPCKIIRAFAVRPAHDGVTLFVYSWPHSWSARPTRNQKGETK
jgi:hypothetical protein